MQMNTSGSIRNKDTHKRDFAFVVAGFAEKQPGDLATFKQMISLRLCSNPLF